MSRKITKVIIENFQSHANTTVDFKDFNAIVGPSDNGKTAIIRAIIWALYNTPSGDSFIRKGESKCQVTILFNDGSSLVKTRTSKTHSYDLYSPGSEPIHLEAFGTGPVDDVVMFHRMGFVDFLGEKQSLNICKQLDSPFFLGESPVTKAIIIGKLGNTEVIDKAIKNNASEMREVKSQEKVYKAQLKEVNQELKELKNLDKMEKAIEFAKVKLDKVKTLESKVINVIDISRKLKDKMEQVSRLESAIVPDEDITKIISDLEDLIKLENNISNIKNISRKIKEEEKRIESLKTLCNIDTALISEVINSLDELCENTRLLNSRKRISNKLNTLESNLINIKELAGKFEETSILIEHLDDALALNKVKLSILSVKERFDAVNQRKSKGEEVIRKLNEDYLNALDKYKSALKESDKCPICMSDISADKLNNIDKYI